MAYLTQVIVSGTSLDVGGGGTGGGSIDGYFNPSDDLFYEESTYTTAITGEANTIYISVDTNKSYRYNGSIFVRLDEESASGGHTIVNSSGTDMTARSKLKFNTSLATTDDSTNGQTIVAVDTMPSADMEEILDPLPSLATNMPVLFDESGAERQVGWYKYSNGTKKPVYEIGIKATSSSSATINNITIPVANIDVIINYYGTLKTSTQIIPVSTYWNSDVIASLLFNIDTASSTLLLRLDHESWENQPIYFTLQYTKTTDTAS